MRCYKRAPIMPPSVPMIVYDSAASVSIKDLFLGGIAPNGGAALVLMTRHRGADGTGVETRVTYGETYIRRAG
ncbi:TRAP transporter large permease subunit [Breznakiellaceae bacterium SP9]